MADLRKKLPIYQVVEADFVDGPPDVENEHLPARRKYGHEHFLNIFPCGTNIRKFSIGSQGPKISHLTD